MTISHNKISKQDLSSFRTWVVDTHPTSEYFQLAQLPDVLTAGRNAFLINGCPELISTTEVLVEIVDSSGKAVYVTPIKNYEEGLARVVSIEVYQNTAPGLATLTILGHLAQTKDGTKPPTEFVDAYNVKWEKTILIAPEKLNTTSIRFSNNPGIFVNEILTAHRTSIPVEKVIFATSSLTTAGNFIITDNHQFSGEMQNGTIQFFVGNSLYATNIVRVLNSNQIETGTNFEINANSSNFTMSFVGDPTYIQTTYTRSFAEINLDELTTFSGQVYRAKVYTTSIDAPNKWQLLTDNLLEPTEILVTSSAASGDPEEKMGIFPPNRPPSQYWSGGAITSMSLYTLGL